MSSRGSGLVLACTGVLFATVESHSWVECTDYDITIDIDSDDFLTDYYVNSIFDVHSDCNGYPRNRRSCNDADWDDCGFHWQPWFDGLEDYGEIRMCRDEIGDPTNGYSDTYDTTYPMAQYTVGEMYRLLWPAKNHAGYECNSDQRDNEMQIWVNLNTNPTVDIDPYVDNELLYSQMEEAGYTLVIDWHADYLAANPDFSFNQRGNTEFGDDVEVYDNVGIDGLPFQNCPHFCDTPEIDNRETQDDSVCYGDFTLPDIFPSDGYYTFVWWWEFKSHEKYSHCFEAYVTTPSPTPGPTDQSNDNGNGNNDDDDGDNDNGNDDGSSEITNTESNYNVVTVTDSNGVVIEITEINDKNEGDGSNLDNKKSNEDDTGVVIALSVTGTALVCCCIIGVIVFVFLKKGKQNSVNYNGQNTGLATSQSTMANIVADKPPPTTTNNTNYGARDGGYSGYNGYGQTGATNTTSVANNSRPPLPSTNGHYGGGANVVSSGHRAPPPPPKRFY